jgi:hypothetical protein
VWKIVTAVVLTVAAVAGPGLPAVAAGAAASAPEVSGIGAFGALTDARLLVRASSPGMSRALASSGDQLWLARFHPTVPGCGFYFARSVAAGPGGDAVFVTEYCGLSRVDFFTVAYDAASGATLWVRRYNGPGNSTDQAVSVAVSPGGDAVYVTGLGTGVTSGHDYVTIAYNAATGARLWIKRYNGPGNGDDAAASVAVSPGGDAVYVTGGSTGVTSGHDYVTIAYNAATGARLWIKRYNGPANSDDVARSLAVSPGTGTVYVTGYSDGSTSGAEYNYLTAAYDAATGARLWVKRYNGPGSGPFSGDFAASVAVSPGGDAVYVTGDSTGATSHQDDLTIAYNAATGARLWAERYNGPANGDDAARSLAVSPGAGTVYVTGESLGFNDPGFGASQDFLTVAYDAATGATLWVRRYNGPAMSGDGATSIAVSPSTGTVFVTGDSNDDPAGSDYVTIAYRG